MYGIDLGTTNSIIGYADKLFTGCVKSSVDLATMRQCDDLANKNTVYSYKKSMTLGKNGEVPIKASSVILKYLVETANRITGNSDNNVVISVPAKFTTTQREAVREASELAGLKLHALINEPTAAAIVACRRNMATLFIMDIGGGTSDISIVDSSTNTCEVYASNGLLIGGDDLDTEIYNRLCDTFKTKVLQKSRGKIPMKREICRMKELFRIDSEFVEIDCTPIGGDEKYRFTIEEYKSCIYHVFNPMIDLSIDLLNQCKGISRSDLKILFVGGSCKNPFLREFFLMNLGMTEYEYQCDKDLTVAMGVAMYAQMVEDGSFKEIVKDTAHRLFIANEMNAEELISPGTFLPAKAQQVLSNQFETDHLHVDFYQGNSIDMNDPGSSFVGSIDYKFADIIPAGQSVMLLKVEEDVNAILHISLQDMVTGIEENVELKI